MDNLKEEIHAYWTARAGGYSEYNRQEMADARRAMWKQKLLTLIGEYFPTAERSGLKVLDAGTGPGFLAILLAEAGCRVTAVDFTEAMLAEARANAGRLKEKICWRIGDVEKTEFPDQSFDIVVTRNVTWNLPHPADAYREWQRILKPGGVLFNFDADWYGHLVDEDKRAGYENDRKRTQNEGYQDYYAGTDIERMEAIAREMPLTMVKRPEWDIGAMKKAGFASVDCDSEVWKQVWTEEEIANNASTPIFLLTGRKAGGRIERV